MFIFDSWQNSVLIRMSPLVVERPTSFFSPTNPHVYTRGSSQCICHSPLLVVELLAAFTLQLSVCPKYFNTPNTHKVFVPFRAVCPLNCGQ